MTHSFPTRRSSDLVASSRRIAGPTLRSGTRLARASRTPIARSEEHTSELQSLMRTSYSVFCLKKKTNHHEASVRLLAQVSIKLSHQLQCQQQQSNHYRTHMSMRDSSLL